MISSSASVIWKSSATSRLLPMPGTPTSVTSCADCSVRARWKASASMPRSRSRPTSGVRNFCSTSLPKRERAATASQTLTGSDFPFASTEGASWYSIACRVARYVPSPTRIPFTGAALCSRAAVLTTSPETIPSPSTARAPSATSATPVLTAVRIWSSSPIESRIASAARTARSGSSSWDTGAPKIAITASPMNFSTVPPCRSSSARSCA